MFDVIALSDMDAFTDTPPEQLTPLLAELNATVLRLAPCLALPENADARLIARGILRDVILRRVASGPAGMLSRSHAVPPFSESVTFDASQPRRALLWPTEIAALEELCATTKRGMRAWMGWNA